MKVLVTYFTQTGNTEQIAKAICDAASKGHEAQIKALEEVKPEDCNNYDIVFVGAPVHAGGLAAPAKEFLEALPQASRFKLAGFATHADGPENPQGFENALKTFETSSQEKGITFMGSYDCQGRLSPDLEPLVKQMKGLSDEEAAALIGPLKEHPNAEDQKKASEFAESLLSKA